MKGFLIQWAIGTLFFIIPTVIVLAAGWSASFGAGMAYFLAGSVAAWLAVRVGGDR